MVRLHCWTGYGLMSRTALRTIQAAAGNVGGDFYPYTIDNSLRFTGSEMMSFSQGTPTNAKKWTFSMWFKYTGPPSSWLGIFGAANGSVYTNFYMNSNHWLLNHYTQGQMDNTAFYRDPSAWYHVVVAFDSTQASAGDRQKIWVNGVKEAQTYSYGAYSLNQELYVNASGRTLYIGRSGETASYSKQYLAECVFIDGQQLDPTNFAETKNGVWVPKEITGLTFGNNGFHLKFDNSGSLGADSSGNGNNFTPSGFSSSDQMIDTPTNNFATFNPLVKEPGRANDNSTYAEGNLYAKGDTSSSNANTQIGIATILYPSSGAWYSEVRHSGYGGVYNSDNPIIGVYTQDAQAVWGMTTNSVMYNGANGGLYVSGSQVSSGGASYSTGSIISVLVDVDNSEIKFYKNGSLQYTYTSSVNLTGFKLSTGDGASTEWNAYILNAGQNGTFNGTVTAGGNSDANGIGDFKYTVPTGALALCTANLPEPTIGPNSATTSDENFNTVLWTGTGATNNITGVGFQPDFTWIKRRSASEHHWLTDAVRGVTKGLYSNLTNAEATRTDQIQSFDSDGFTLGVDGAGYTNASGSTYVGWNWKANGSGSSNTDGSITSTVSANQDAGISIVGWAGTGTGSATVGHGLGVEPAVVITKQRGSSPALYDWYMYHKSLGASYYIRLNRTNASVNDTGTWSNTAPSSTVITLGATTSNWYYVHNYSGTDYIAYAFAEVEGFSSFGKYTGNGSTDGSFVYTGFRPAFVLVKSSTYAGTFWLMSADPNGYNVVDTYLHAESSDAEYSPYTWIDYLSNGFKLRQTGDSLNRSGQTYIYMAFAENPFKYANAR